MYSLALPPHHTHTHIHTHTHTHTYTHTHTHIHTSSQNNVLDLWSLFDFLMPGFLGTESSRQFYERFGKPILLSRDSKSSSKEQEAGTWLGVGEGRRNGGGEGRRRKVGEGG